MQEKIRPGYKQTELGHVPIDWDIFQIGEIAELITSGSRGWAKFYSERGPLFVRSQNVREGYLDFSDRQHVMPPSGSEGSRTQLQKDDLLITITGNSVGNVAWVKGELGEAYISQHVGMIRLKNSFIGEYINLFLAPGSPGNAQIWASQAGQSKPGLNLKNLADFCVAFPPLPGQRAIAKALGDADARIAALEAVIAKKRDLKQAVLQQLLTGKTRLPGFSGQWAVRRLGELGATYGGLTGKSKVDFGHGDAQYVPFMNVMSNVVVDTTFLENVDLRAGESQNRAQSGDLFFNGSSETPEEVGMCALLTEEIENLYLNSFCFGFRFKSGAAASGRYLANYFRSQMGRELLASLAQGATRYNLSKRALLSVEFPCPSVAEQIAIAEILSDMDADLAAVEAEAVKARTIKQGMMQSLLTGQVRLI